MSFKIKDDITWVGKIDWEPRKFHGDEFSTHRGSSYNSYLIRDEKTAFQLIRSGSHLQKNLLKI